MGFTGFLQGLRGGLGGGGRALRVSGSLLRGSASDFGASESYLNPKNLPIFLRLL